MNRAGGRLARRKPEWLAGLFMKARWNHLYALWERALALDPLPPFDRWLSAEWRKCPQFGRRDRLWYGERLFAALRHGLVAPLLAEALRGKETAAESGALEIFERFARDFPDFASIRAGWQALGAREFFRLLALREGEGAERDPALPPPAPAAARIASRLREAAASPEAPLFARLLWSGVPPAFAPALERRAVESGWSRETLGRFLGRLDSRPPLWLCVHREEDRAPVEEELRARGFRVLESEGDALAVEGPRSIYDLDSWRRGRFGIQDWASRRAGRCVEARPGQCVWDVCAGGGGKTRQLAAALQNRGAVYATDTRAWVLDELRRRAREAGFFNIRAAPWDGETPPEFPREVQKRGGFDWVLVDAPCSSSGVWRRNPDAKFRYTPGEAAEMAALQGAILRRAAEAVRPGGGLVYATCSWFVEEDEDVARAFAVARPDFTLVSMELFGSPARDSDTLFAAIFRRRAAAAAEGKEQPA